MIDLFDWLKKSQSMSTRRTSTFVIGSFFQGGNPAGDDVSNLDRLEIVDVGTSLFWIYIDRYHIISKTTYKNTRF